MTTDETEPKIGFKPMALTDEFVAAHLAKEITRYKPTVMIDERSRYGRSHVRLHHDKAGYFVRMGKRGALKRYLGRCKITYLDGEATLFVFTCADMDAFDADQSRRWDAKYGVTA